MRTDKTHSRTYTALTFTIQIHCRKSLIICISFVRLIYKLNNIFPLHALCMTNVWHVCYFNLLIWVTVLNIDVKGLIIT